MDSLKLLAVLKNALKRLKSFLFLIDNKVDGADKNDSKNSLSLDGDNFEEDNRQQHTDELDLELKTLKEEYIIKILKWNSYLLYQKMCKSKKWTGHSKNDST